MPFSNLFLEEGCASQLVLYRKRTGLSPYLSQPVHGAKLVYDRVRARTRTNQIRPRTLLRTTVVLHPISPLADVTEHGSSFSFVGSTPVGQSI